jgi:carbon starvation protein CstA
MTYFFASVGMLILGYFVYGKVIDRLFGADPLRPTPALTKEDGVDYIKLPPWKMWFKGLTRELSIPSDR